METNVRARPGREPVKEGSMAISKQHRILIASDGSGPARAALATALKFPWPASSRACAVVARFPWLPSESEQAHAAVEKSFEVIAAAARRALARRWAESQVVVIVAAFLLGL